MTTPVSSSAASQAASAATSSGVASLNTNFNTFLTLLTTQLQNQDPLSPLDTNQFTQQLVSFSEVEQQINTNTNLQSLIAMQNTSQALSALPLVGQTINYSGATAPLANGKASFTYTLPTTAIGATLTVKDSNGATVFSGSAQTAAGTYTFNWDGKTSSGGTAPNGDYTLSVAAVDASGNTITPTITASGKVDGVSVVNNVATFNVGGVPVPMTSFISSQTSSSTSN
jgi:flagellar basal-body rod modification protein FlgD